MHCSLRVRQGDDAQVPGMLIQSLIEIDPQLARPRLIEELASREDIASRMSAAMILESLARVAPALVPLGLLGRSPDRRTRIGTCSLRR